LITRPATKGLRTARKAAKKRSKSRLGTFSLPQGLISAASKLKIDFHRFLFLISIALLFGGSGVTLAFGCIMGFAVMALVVIFILCALYMRFWFLHKTCELKINLKKERLRYSRPKRKSRCPRRS
jgi:hypothetical protein